MTKSVAHDTNPFGTPHFVNRGRYLAQMLDYPTRVPNLPWRPDLYQDSRSVKQQPYFVQGPTNKLAPGEKCDYVGCNQAHGYRYKWQRRGDYGMGWRISYFCSDAHKTLAIRDASK